MRGTIRNIANQLAQIAAGWEASFDGPALLGGPPKGSYLIDLVRNASAINGREVNLGITTVLDKWLEGELGRLGRDRDWLSTTTVEVMYELVPSDAFMDSHQGCWTSQAFVAKLSATASVATPDGAAEASFENAQAVNGKTADPARPMPNQDLPPGVKGRPFQIKRKDLGKPMRRS